MNSVFIGVWMSWHKNQYLYMSKQRIKECVLNAEE